LVRALAEVVVSTVVSLNFDLVTSNGFTTVIRGCVPGESDIAVGSEGGGDGLHATRLVSGSLALDDEDVGISASASVASSDSVLDGPGVLEHVVFVGGFSCSGSHFNLVDVLSGSEVDTTPSEVPEDLVSLDTSLTLPFESDGSKVANRTIVVGGHETSTSVGPSGHVGLARRVLHANILS